MEEGSSLKNSSAQIEQEMRNSFDPENTQQLELNFRGGFCETYQEEEQEFEEEITRVLSLACENENALITAITIEEFKL